MNDRETIYTIKITGAQFSTIRSALNMAKLQVENPAIRQECDEVFFHLLRTAKKEEPEK